MEKKVATQELTPGMYDSRLDRPWMETFLLLQGFEIIRSLDPGHYEIASTAYYL
ncbi:MAG: DUF3391 domain-containing protein [Gammaproteobacteria bacterium]|nr:DUF3391 domain-containing protein [Gammaproteobacteria bacterium]